MIPGRSPTHPGCSPTHPGRSLTCPGRSPTPVQVSRALLTFGRSRHALLLALLGLAPFGEAVLSTGIYTVALNKLTLALSLSPTLTP